MLPLHGFAKHVWGFASTDARTVCRLRLPNRIPAHSADVALVRGVNELAEAQSSGFKTAIIISDNEPTANGTAAPGQLIQLASEFDYLADGDILGFHPGSKRFRTVYRRASAHNSFLVTERCNHYCLMCS